MPSRHRAPTTKPTLGMVALAQAWGADAVTLSRPETRESFTPLGVEAFRVAGRMVGRVMWRSGQRPPPPSSTPSRL